MILNETPIGTNQVRKVNIKECNRKLDHYVIKGQFDLKLIDINYEEDCKDTPLVCACENGHIEIVKYLLTFPTIDVNAGLVLNILLLGFHFILLAIKATST